MKFKEAMEIIEEKETNGYMVAFEEVMGRFLESNYFPGHNEDPIETEELAWTLARKFAEKTRGKYVNIYVINRNDYTPVSGYQEKMINNR